MAVKRIKKELTLWQSYHMLEPVDDDIFIIQGYLFGPPQTIYDGYAWRVTFQISSDYPFKPPKLLPLGYEGQKCPIYHLNFNDSGGTYIPELHSTWCPALTISMILDRLEDLLDQPFLYSDVDPNSSFLGTFIQLERGELYAQNRCEYDRLARERTLEVGIPVIFLKGNKERLSHPRWQKMIESWEISNFNEFLKSTGFRKSSPAANDNTASENTVTASSTSTLATATTPTTTTVTATVKTVITDLQEPVQGLKSTFSVFFNNDLCKIIETFLHSR